MEKKPLIEVSMLGGFVIKAGDKKIEESGNRSKKIFVLLAFLILYRRRMLSQTELIEAVWGEDKAGDVTISALKTLCCRARDMLKTLNYPDKLIIAKSGSYTWNPDVEIVLDVERFMEVHAKAASAENDSVKRGLYEEVIEMYRGELLPRRMDCSWVIPLCTYYHSVFVKSAHELIRLCRAAGDYNKIVAVCCKVIKFETLDEDIHYELINGYYQMKNYNQALEQYYFAQDVYYREEGINFPQKLNDIYGEIARQSKNTEEDISNIREELKEEKEQWSAGTFYCEYRFFRDFYRVQCRVSSRNKQEVYLCLLTVMSLNGELPGKRILNKCMEDLKEVIHNSARSGDIFTRYSVSQYLFCVSGITLENTEKIMKRIQSKFRKVCPRKDIVLEYQFISSLE